MSGGKIISIKIKVERSLEDMADTAFSYRLTQ